MHCLVSDEVSEHIVGRRSSLQLNERLWRDEQLPHFVR